MEWGNDSGYSRGLLEPWGDDNHKASRGGLNEVMSASQWQLLLGGVRRMDMVVLGAKGGPSSKRKERVPRQGLGKSHGI